MTIPLQAEIAYGPVASRRLGRSLGVNILPGGRKVCNFNCAYCQYGWTPPSPLARGGIAQGAAYAAASRERADTSADWRYAALSWPPVCTILDAVDGALSREPDPDCITLAGNGEPTLHPEFPRIVDGLLAVRTRRAPSARVVLLSNASTAGDPGVAGALARIDECYMKLDAGDDAMLRRMNGSKVPLRAIVEGLRSLPGVTLQSLFTRDARRRIDNTSAIAVDRWLDAVREIAPKAVHVYSIDRAPAWKQLERIPRAELEAIAGRVERAGTAAVVF